MVRNLLHKCYVTQRDFVFMSCIVLQIGCKSQHMTLAVSANVQLGFFGILLVEALAGKGIFEMAGFTVGNGLGFEF